MVSGRDSGPQAAERSSIDDIVDLYARDVDATLLRANLRRTVDERLQQAEELFALRQELQTGMQRAEAR